MNGRVDVEVSHRVEEVSKCMGGMKSVMISTRAVGMTAKEKVV